MENNINSDRHFDKQGYIKYDYNDYNEEIWKKITITPEYEMSNLGRVRNRKSKYILKPLKDKDGYLRLLLRNKNDNNISTIIIHQWVAKLFLREGIKESLIVNHINEIKQDNRSENLEWVTHSENTNHGTRNKRVSESLSKPIILESKEGIRFYFDSCSSLEKVTDGKLTRKGSSSAKNRKGVHRGFKVLDYDGDKFDYDCGERNNNNELDKNIEYLTSIMDTKAIRPNAKFHLNGDNRKPIIGIDKVTGEEISYSSILEAEEYGFTRSNIIAVIQGKRKSHKGYMWKYTIQ